MAKKVSVIFGTRPEAIKLAPVILALKDHPDFACHVCVTAQHRQMLDQVLDAFDIRPDADLNLMQQDQPLSSFTARCLEALDRYLASQRPALVLAQGDTTTTFCASLAAFYRRIPIGHVEAGLRTKNKYAPFPEEINRTLVSHLADLHFAPTEGARQNLLRQGVPADRIFVTGNTVIDALFLALEKTQISPPSIPGLPPELLQPENHIPIVLITGHRRESFGPPLESICLAIRELAHRFPETHFVYPVHLNPHVRAPVLRILGSSPNPPTSDLRPLPSDSRSPTSDHRPLPSGTNIHLIDPLPYFPFVALMNRSTLILTDSGGIQEEAPSLGKPVLVMRDTTERPEGVEAGTARLVGTDTQKIVSEVSKLLTDKVAYDSMAQAHNPYGDGKAAHRILQAILQSEVWDRRSEVRGQGLKGEG